MADSGYATQEQASQALIDSDEDHSNDNQSSQRIKVEDPLLHQVAILAQAASSPPSAEVNLLAQAASSSQPRSPKSPPPLHECLEEDWSNDSIQSDVFKNDKKSTRFVCMRRMMMKKFFIRSFLAKKYPIPEDLKSYKSFESLVSVDIYGTEEIVWQVTTNGEKALTDALIEFYRDQQRCWFCTLSIKGNEKVFLKTKGDHIDNLMQAFLNG